MKKHSLSSFKSSLFISCLMIAFIPLVFSSLTIRYLFTDMLIRDANIQGEEKISELVAILHTVLQDSENMMVQLSQDATIHRALLERGDESLQKDTYLKLYQAIKESHSQVEFALYDMGGHLRYTTLDTGQEPRLFVNWGILRKASQSSETQYLAQTQAGTQGNIRLRMNRPIETTGELRIGYIVCSITQAQMSQIFAGFSKEDGTIFLFSPQGRLLYSSRANTGAEADNIRRAMLGETIQKSEDDLLFCSVEPSSQCLVVLQRPVPLSSRAVELMSTILFISTVLCIILCILVSFGLSRSLFAPIGNLSTAMQKVHDGDLTTRVPVASRDEIGVLSQNFNAMTEQLQIYVAEQVQHQKDLSAAQIRQMQAQLNPHFLYNTLDTMKWLARIHKIPEMASLAGNLAGLLRYSITNEQFITLRQELSILERYIGIQKIRFDEKFEYVLNIPDSLLDYTVPKMLLQPLVENAILHGLKDRDSGTIYICAKKQEDILEISVTDDGCGMPPNMVARINSPQPKILEGHLGLYNINCILKLHYGEEYGLYATSYPDIGTTVVVRLPIAGGGMNA